VAEEHISLSGLVILVPDMPSRKRFDEETKYDVAKYVADRIVAVASSYIRGNLPPVQQLVDRLVDLFAPFVAEVPSDRRPIVVDGFAKLVNVAGKPYAVVYDEWFSEMCIALADLSDAELRFACDVKSFLTDVIVYRFLHKGDATKLFKIISEWLGNIQREVAWNVYQDVLDSLRRSISADDIVRYMMAFPDDIDDRVVRDLLKDKNRLYALRELSEAYGGRKIESLLNRLDLLGIDRNIIMRILENVSDASKHPYYLVVLCGEALNLFITVYRFDEDAPRGEVLTNVVSREIFVGYIGGANIVETISSIFFRLDIDRFKRFLQNVRKVDSRYAKRLLYGLADAIRDGYSLLDIDGYYVLLLPIDKTAKAVIINDDVHIAPAWMLLMAYNTEDMIQNAVDWERRMGGEFMGEEREKIFWYLLNNEILSKLPQDIAEKIVEKFYEYSLTT